MPEYKKFLGNSVNFAKEHAGDILRYAAIPLGAVSGYMALHSTGDAVAAEKAMWEAAYIFAAGELLNYYKFIRSSEGNVFNHLGKIVSFAAPFVAAVFLKDNSFNPALTLGMIPAWGAGKGVEKLGDAVETGKIEKDYLTSGRNAMLENINKLSDNQLAKYLAILRKK